MDQKRSRSEADIRRVVLLYAIFAGCWILFSDNLMGLLFHDPSQLTLVSTLKGLAFVAVTSFFLFILLQRFASRHPEIPEKSCGLAGFGSVLFGSRKLLAVFLLFMTGAVAVGWSTYHSLSGIIRQKQGAELMATSELKRRQVEDWLAERRLDMMQLSRGLLFRDALMNWMRSGDVGLRRKLQDRMDFACQNYGLLSVAFHDASGRQLLAAGEAHDVDDALMATLRRAASESDVVFVDMKRYSESTPLAFAFASSVPAADGSSAALGALVFWVDPEKVFFPLVQSWPRPSGSGETLIVRREGEEVVFMNRLRHSGRPPLSIRFPLSRPDLPAARTFLQGPGLYEGVDYRNVQVLAASQQVKGTPWMMIAKIDRTEVYQDIQRLSFISAGLTFIAIIAGGFLMLFVWQTQRMRDLAALSESEARYGSLFENMINGFAHCRMLFVDGRPDDFVYLHVNRAFEKLTGLRDVVGKKVSEVIPGIRDSDPELFEIYGRVAATGNPEKVDIHVEALREWFSVSVYCPEPGQFVAIFDVITDRKKAAAKLAEREVFLSSVLDSIQDFISILSPDLRILRVNRSLQQFFSDKAPLEGSICYEAYHGRSMPCEICPSRETFMDAKPHFKDFSKLNSDGSTRYLELSTFPILGPAGSVTAVVECIRDTTEKVTLEEEREQYHRRLELILEAAGEGIFGLNTKGEIIFVNKMALTLLGAGADELIGRNSHEVFHSFRPDGVEYPWAECPNCKTLGDGLSRSGEEIYYRSDGSSFPVEYTCTPIIREGLVEGVVVSFRDVSDRRKLEDQYRQAQKMEAVGQLAGGIAHDYNNILSAIIGYCTLAGMKVPEDHPVRHDIDQVMQAAERATTLTQGLLTFSRKHPLKRELIVLNDVIERFRKILLRLLREDIDLHTKYAAEELTVLADRGQIEQVIMNLVTNARDAMPSRGSLYIETGLFQIDDEFVKNHGYGSAGDYAVISVTDTGMGMDEKTKQRIFEPFFTTKELGKGTGLGLATVYGIIKSHGGFINVYSEPGRGTTFRLYFPLVRGEARKAEPRPAPAELRGGSETILLAEDDRAVRRLIASVLDHVGYHVIEAVDGNDAIEKFFAGKDSISLVILDGIMPGLNGLEVYREISSIYPQMRFIFMSGYAEDVFTVNGILQVEMDFISKPIPPTVLLNKVREVLDR